MIFGEKMNSNKNIAENKLQSKQLKYIHHNRMILG